MISLHNIRSEPCHTARVEADLYRTALACSIFPVPILPTVLGFDVDIDLSTTVLGPTVAAQLAFVADSQNPSVVEVPTSAVVAIQPHAVVEVDVVSPQILFVLGPAHLTRNLILALDLSVVSGWVRRECASNFSRSLRKRRWLCIIFKNIGWILIS